MRKTPSNVASRGSCESGSALMDVFSLIAAFRSPRLWPVLLAACSYEPPTNHVNWALDGGTRSCNSACYDRSVDLAERDRREINGRPGVEEIELWACKPGTARDTDGNSIRDDKLVPAGEGLCAPREEFDCEAARADQRSQVDVPITDPLQPKPPVPAPADAGSVPQSPVVSVPGPTTCAEACRQQPTPLDCNFGVTPGGGRRLPSQPLRPGDTAVCFGETPPGVQCSE